MGRPHLVQAGRFQWGDELVERSSREQWFAGPWLSSQQEQISKCHGIWKTECWLGQGRLGTQHSQSLIVLFSRWLWCRHCLPCSRVGSKKEGGRNPGCPCNLGKGTTPLWCSSLFPICLNGELNTSYLSGLISIISIIKWPKTQTLSLPLNTVCSASWDHIGWSPDQNQEQLGRSFWRSWHLSLDEGLEVCQAKKWGSFLTRWKRMCWDLQAGASQLCWGTEVWLGGGGVRSWVPPQLRASEELKLDPWAMQILCFVFGVSCLCAYRKGRKKWKRNSKLQVICTYKVLAVFL
jgi:hypothetical protein